MAELVLGAVTEEALSVILEFREKVVSFPEDVEKLRNTLDYVIPLIKEGRCLDLELNDHKSKKLEDMILKLNEGEKLVKECCKVPSWNIFQKIQYSIKISQLVESISRFCGMELQVENWRDNKLLIGLIKELIIQHQQSPISGVSVGVPLLRNEGLFAVPELPDPVVGFEMRLKELKNELFKENLTLLGLCAPGGCGKSTLAAMLCHDEQVKRRFKNRIFFVTVSMTPSLRIAQRLVEEIGGGVSGSDLSEEDATKQFHHLLKQRKSEQLLLVLDNVWDESLIERFFSRTEGYKMLVTSRTEFKRFNSKYHSKYLLKTLSEQHSMDLFRCTAFSQDGKDDYEPDEDILNKIVRCCGGFPFAITVIAKSLSQQPPLIWKNMAKKLSKGAHVLDFDEKLRERLAASLDTLGKTARECFLDLGSFPKDKRIPASALIDMWCEFYERDDESDAFVILLELASRSLINLVGSRKSVTEIVATFNELFVTQHDLLRDLAIYWSREQQSKRLIMDKKEEGLPESWRKKGNLYLDARLVSLCTGEMCLENWYDLQLPEVEVLILNFFASNYALPPFVEKMRMLKVLMIVNHGRAHTKLSNLITVGKFASLKRIRLEKVSIPSLHEFKLPLTNLQKISLVMCDFSQASMECTINVSNVLPNLIEIDIDCCHNLVELPPWICDIKTLRILSITNCDNLSALPERIGCITDLELLRLHASCMYWIT